MMLMMMDDDLHRQDDEFDRRNNTDIRVVMQNILLQLLSHLQTAALAYFSEIAFCVAHICIMLTQYTCMRTFMA